MRRGKLSKEDSFTSVTSSTSTSSMEVVTRKYNKERKALLGGSRHEDKVKSDLTRDAGKAAGESEQSSTATATPELKEKRKEISDAKGRKRTDEVRSERYGRPIEKTAIAKGIKSGRRVYIDNIDGTSTPEINLKGNVKGKRVQDTHDSSSNSDDKYDDIVETVMKENGKTNKDTNGEIQAKYILGSSNGQKEDVKKKKIETRHKTQSVPDKGTILGLSLTSKARDEEVEASLGNRDGEINSSEMAPSDGMIEKVLKNTELQRNDAGRRKDSKDSSSTDSYDQVEGTDLPEDEREKHGQSKAFIKEVKEKLRAVKKDRDTKQDDDIKVDDMNKMKNKSKIRMEEKVPEDVMYGAINAAGSPMTESNEKNKKELPSQLLSASKRRRHARGLKNISKSKDSSTENESVNEQTDSSKESLSKRDETNNKDNSQKADRKRVNNDSNRNITSKMKENKDNLQSKIHELKKKGKATNEDTSAKDSMDTAAEKGEGKKLSKGKKKKGSKDRIRNDRSKRELSSSTESDTDSKAEKNVGRIKRKITKQIETDKSAITAKRKSKEQQMNNIRSKESSSESSSDSEKDKSQDTHAGLENKINKIMSGHSEKLVKDVQKEIQSDEKGVEYVENEVEYDEIPLEVNSELHMESTNIDKCAVDTALLCKESHEKSSESDNNESQKQKSERTVEFPSEVRQIKMEKSDDLQILPDDEESGDVQIPPDDEKTDDVQILPDDEESDDVQIPPDVDRSDDVQILPDDEKSDDVQIPPDDEESEDIQIPPDDEESDDVQIPPDDEKSDDVQILPDDKKSDDLQIPSDDEESDDLQIPPDDEKSDDLQIPSDDEESDDVQIPPDDEKSDDVQILPDDKKSDDLQIPSDDEESDDLQIPPDDEKSDDLQIPSDDEESDDVQIPPDDEKSDDVQILPDDEESEDLQIPPDVEKPDDLQIPPDGRMVREEAFKATEISFEQAQKSPSSNELESDECSEIAELFDDEGNAECEVCQYCKNQYEYPILLNCAHTFCRECVSMFVESSNGLSFQCPTCLAHIKLTEGEEELFCPNFMLLQQMRKARSGDTGCVNCGTKKKADAICEDCVELYCAQCADGHRARKLTKQHKISDISSVEDPKKLKKRYFCPKHRKKQLSVYCLLCDLSICKECASEEHNGGDHDCGPVNEAAEASRQILDTTSKQLEKEQPGVSEDIENISAMLDGLDVELEEMKTEIKSSVENLISALREQESRLYNEVERKHHTICDALLARKEGLATVITQTSHITEFLKELKNHENDIEMLQMAATVSKQTRELEEAKHENEVIVDYDFVFNSRESKLKQAIDKHGFISVRDRISGREIVVEGFSGVNEVSSGSDSEDEAAKTWSPREKSKKGHGKKHRKKVKEKIQKSLEKQVESVTEEIEEKRNRETDVKEHIQKETEKMNTRQQEEITYEFSGDKVIPDENFTQLISERGEDVRNLKFNVMNHKNEACEVDIKMICPDNSIVSAHVTESSDGAFTVFFCPEIKKDFNCFISIGGEHFKKEHKVLNFYGDFQGMRSKEIDLTCRAISLLRWHITPGLLEKKHGIIRRSKKFLKMKTN